MERQKQSLERDAPIERENNWIAPYFPHQPREVSFFFYSTSYE